MASTWNSNWTNIKPGEFEIYDSILAFAGQAELTSTVRPVYIINGAFAEYSLMPGANSGIKGDTAEIHYWGDSHKTKTPWTAMDDAATWTIELVDNEAVKQGEECVFQFQSKTTHLRN